MHFKVVPHSVLALAILACFQTQALATDPIAFGDYLEITDSVDISATDENGILVDSGKSGKITSDSIIVNVTSNTAGSLAAVRARKGSSLTLGSEASKIYLSNTSDTGKLVIGLAAFGDSSNRAKGSQVTIEGDLLDISVSSDSNDAYGLLVQNNTYDKDSDVPTGTTSVTINSKQTIIKATAGSESKSHGIVALSEGQLTVNGDLSITADKAIVARGNSSVYINKSGNDSIVTVNGNIDFNYDKATSGTAIEADVQLYLTNAQSKWTGNVTYSYDVQPESEKLDVSKMFLHLSNGATWEPTTITDTTATRASSETISALSLNHLESSGGIVLLKNTDVTIDKVSGESLNVQVFSDGNSDNSNKLKIESVGDTTPTIHAVYGGADNGGITSDDYSSADEAFKANNAIEAPASIVLTEEIAEGDVNGIYTKVTDENGVTSIVMAENTKISGYTSMLTASVLQWRSEMTDLSDRMGNLRSSEGKVGVWARTYQNKNKVGDQNVKAKNFTFQTGVDYRISDWILGGAFSYTDGSSHYSGGHGDNKAYSFGLYGTWMADSGIYVDLIGKYGRLHNKFSASNMHGKFNNNAFSLSAELGWNYQVTPLFFIEPQAQLSYGQISGKNFNTSNDVSVHQKDFNSVVGRLGFRTGITCPITKSQGYIKASVLHDWDGKIKGTVSNSKSAQSINKDLSGTYFEYGVGGQLNINKNAYVYTDFSKQSGGPVKEPWRWNVGVRVNF